jgi:pilus assembly protein CpaB
MAGGLLAAAALTLATTPHGATVARASRQTEPAGAVSVLIAAHPIAAGSIISPADIATKTVVAPPSTALTASDAALGRMALNAINGGAILTSADLQDVSATGIAGRLATGQRAFSIRVAEDDIVGGFLQSGDRVDILATLPGSIFPAKGAENVADRSKVLLLLQNIPVLAVGENLAPGGAAQPGARTASLALTPAELTRLTLALRFGKVSLAIRKPGDGETSPAVDATLADLLSAGHETGPVAGRASSPAATRRIPFYAGTRAAAIDVRGMP